MQLTQDLATNSFQKNRVWGSGHIKYMGKSWSCLLYLKNNKKSSNNVGIYLFKKKKLGTGLRGFLWPKILPKETPLLPVFTNLEFSCGMHLRRKIYSHLFSHYVMSFQKNTSKCHCDHLRNVTYVMKAVKTEISLYQLMHNLMWFLLTCFVGTAWRD